MKVPRFLNHGLAFVLFALVFTLSSKAQSFTQLDWAFSIPSSNDERAEITTIDAEGNVFVGGNYSEGFDADPGTGTTYLDNVTTTGFGDVFLAKYDSSGNLLWVKAWGSQGVDLGHDLETDADGNVWIAFLFQDSIDLDPGSGTFMALSPGRSGIGLVNLDASGNFVRGFKLADVAWAFELDVEVDMSGSLYLSGGFTDSLDVDLSDTSSHWIYSNGGLPGCSAAYVAKYSPAGNFIWASAFQTLTSMPGYSLTNMDFTVMPGNSVAVLGIFDGGVDLDPSAGSFDAYAVGGYDFYLVKLGSDGSFGWAKTWGTTASDWALHVGADAAGNLTLAGYLEAEVMDFDPGLGVTTSTPMGSQDMFMIHLNAMGDFLWGRTVGSSAVDRGYQVEIREDGRILLSGVSSGLPDFDPGPAVATLPYADLYHQCLAQYQPTGELDWVIGLGHDNEYSAQLEHVTAKDGAIVVANAFRFAFDCDPGADTLTVPYYGNFDFYFARFIDGVISHVQAPQTSEAFAIVPNPSPGWVKVPTCGISQVQVWAANGALVWSGSTTPEGEVDLSPLPAGIYCLSVMCEGQRRQALWRKL